MNEKEIRSMIQRLKADGVTAEDFENVPKLEEPIVWGLYEYFNDSGEGCCGYFSYKEDGVYYFTSVKRFIGIHEYCNPGTNWKRVSHEVIDADIEVDSNAILVVEGIRYSKDGNAFRLDKKYVNKKLGLVVLGERG